LPNPCRRFAQYFFSAVSHLARLAPPPNRNTVHFFAILVVSQPRSQCPCLLPSVILFLHASFSLENLSLILFRFLLDCSAEPYVFFFQPADVPAAPFFNQVIFEPDAVPTPRAAASATSFSNGPIHRRARPLPFSQLANQAPLVQPRFFPNRVIDSLSQDAEIRSRGLLPRPPPVFPSRPKPQPILPSLKPSPVSEFLESHPCVIILHFETFPFA